MKLWKRWTAAVLAAAMVLLLLAACGPSGPSAPDTPEKPGTGETGKDPTDPGTGEPGKDPEEENTGAQKKAAVVEALNTVRKNYGNNTPLELNEQACAIAKEMAQVQLDGVNGKYGENPSTNTDYIAACANVRKKKVGEKASIGFGGLQGAYPDANQFKKWADKTEGVSAERNNALVKSKEATLVGVGVVHNTDPKTRDKYPIMVVVMTY
jgi:predicted small lipoprotein YifL